VAIANRWTSISGVFIPECPRQRALWATNYIEITRGVGYREGVVAPQGRVTRTHRRAAALALALGLAAGGCYSTTPHRAEISTPATKDACAAAIGDVFERAGYVQLPTRQGLSYLFGPRLSGAYSSFLLAGSGIGVTVSPIAAAEGTCHVTIEALSPDVGCPVAAGPLGCGTAQVVATNGPSGGRSTVQDGTPPCPVVPPAMCELTSAPGAGNDAAVDELARRLRATLGPSGAVN
jgi:hypothetical protein